jgi:hypothetical protein
MKKEEFWQIMREYMIAKQTIIYAIGEEDADFFFQILRTSHRNGRTKQQKYHGDKKKIRLRFLPNSFWQEEEISYRHTSTLVFSLAP